MELPLGGPALRHYTRSRPRPHRLNKHLRPSRAQELVDNIENEVPDHMGRVDEGVEEFFTKRVFPFDALKKQNENEEPRITEQEMDMAPACTAPCPAPSRTLRRKLGEFFTLKKRRGVKSDGSQEGRAKKTSIADLIRPLRDAARAEKEKMKDSEKEKVGVDDSSTTLSSVDPTPLRGEAPPRRALREGKSQSLILLSGSAANSAVTKNSAQGKKQCDGPHGFEQRLQLMLQRIGMSRTAPGETQSQEGEMKKAESEGTIIDNKPEPPPTFVKPRTMSTSSDTRRPVRQSVSAHESAGKPALPPKPIIKRGPTPPPTLSGRLTPENDLAQIQEGDPTGPNHSTSPVPTTTIHPAPKYRTSLESALGLLSISMGTKDLDPEKVERNMETEEESKTDGSSATQTEKEPKSVVHYIGETMKEERDEGMLEVGGSIREGGEMESNEKVLSKTQAYEKREGVINVTDDKEFETDERIESKIRDQLL
ncbi:hypothetical protein UPYG_G00084610 [Umbra pygmaea]|uniref:CARMIL C-terminal domain-containing protein n=1 Tax=Umbra pygmaea TaxID=75934 RepID=A0ABD0XHU1_UMBPY